MSSAFGRLYSMTIPETQMTTSLSIFGKFVKNVLKLQHRISLIRPISTRYYCSVTVKPVNRVYLGKLKTMKLDTPQFHSIFNPELKALIGLFEKYNYELRIAGGAVRDLILGKTPHDLDFATTATPEEMVAMFTKEEIRMINDNGLKHGTVTARINDKENFEVTTLRIDVTTDGRRAEVEFTKDWLIDANRRDLTINAMFLGFDGTVYDYFNGGEDLLNRKVRFVGDAVKRIQEDYLRILRYFRFYGRIADHPDAHDASTLKSISENIDGLQRISGERIWTELNQILVGRHAASVVIRMIDTGLGPVMGLPAKANSEEILKAFGNSEGLNPQPMTRLSALLGSEDQVYEFHKRVKLSTNELKLGLFLVAKRDVPVGEDRVKHYKDLMCDTVAKEPLTIDRICELQKYRGHKDLLENTSVWIPPKFPMSGKHLIERGVDMGPAFAKTLEELRNIWKESNYTLTEETLKTMIDDIVEKYQAMYPVKKKQRKSKK